MARLSELESILEYASVEAKGDPGLADYLSKHLKPFAPHAPEPRNPEIMRAWLSGQLLEVLGFMHDDPGVMGVPRYEESSKSLRRLEAHYRHRELDEWTSTSRITGVVGVEFAEAVFAYLCEELESSSRSAMRVDRSGRPERVAEIEELGALDWAGTSEYILAWEHLSSGYGLNREFGARMRLGKEHATFLLNGPWAFPVNVLSLFELLVQLSRRSPRFAPQFESSDELTKESFEALWRCVRAIRTRR